VNMDLISTSSHTHSDIQSDIHIDGDIHGPLVFGELHVNFDVCLVLFGILDDASLCKLCFVSHNFFRRSPASYPSLMALALMNNHHSCVQFLLKNDVKPWWDEHHGYYYKTISDTDNNEKKNKFLVDCVSDTRFFLGMKVGTLFSKTSSLNYAVDYDRYDSFQILIDYFPKILNIDKKTFLSLYTSLCIASAQGKLKELHIPTCAGRRYGGDTMCCLLISIFF